MTYYIYHIPGQKIGVTRNLNKRVTEQQGYAPDEYEVLFEGEDIDLISRLEIELQKSYGYRVDRKLYKDLFKPKTMRVNPTNQTTTFPVPVEKLKGRLMDNIGMSWITPQGYRFTIDKTNIQWIMDNCRISHFNTERCYIYNKAFHEYEQSRFKAQKAPENECCLGEYQPFDNIRCWAKERGIYDKGDTKTQFSKLVEEVGELAKAILEEDDVEFVDAIGDCVVVLTNLAHLGGYSIEECVEAAWTQISTRKGKMQNGTFVKEQNRADETISRYLASKTATL
jgi:NTP pyrophosphatase (non-canonical NTP hydrolase)